MSVLGKTSILVCDQCAEPLGEPYTCIVDPRPGGKQHRFHPACYLDEKLKQLFAPELEKVSRDERNTFWKKVCPACRNRLKVYDP